MAEHKDLTNKDYRPFKALLVNPAYRFNFHCWSLGFIGDQIANSVNLS
jgi:hypothetical protein